MSRGGSEVESIQIDPQWNGVVQPSRTAITIQNVNGVFRRSWYPLDSVGTGGFARLPAQLAVQTQNPDADAETRAITHDEVSQDAIAALLTALHEPALAAPKLENLGITREWLSQRADEAAKHTGALGEVNDEKQQEFFRRSFTDLLLIQKLLPGIVQESWTDDGAWVHVSVVFSDHTEWTAESNELPPFMLPWNCKVAGQTMRTYNANISRTVAALLPHGTVNKDRLAGVGLERLIEEAVETSIKAEWQRIGAEARAGTALAQLRSRYVVKRSEVSDHQSLTFGEEGNDGTPPVTYLQADVRLAAFPKNLVVATVFPIRSGNVEGVDTFLRLGSHYERIILANPWLMKSLRAHADLGAWLLFVRDASFSEKAMRLFAADMHALGRDDVAIQVEGHRKDVALLNYYGNELILFPDYHAVVWRWGAYRELFSWPASSLKTERCTDYNTVTEGCVGAIIAPDGSLQVK